MRRTPPISRRRSRRFRWSCGSGSHGRSAYEGIMAQAKQLPVALVTGVGPGLGASLARRFAKDYAVALNARSADSLRSLAGEIRAAGGVALEVPADIGDRAEVEKAFRSIRARLGPPELLIYNAGSGAWGNLTQIKPD